MAVTVAAVKSLGEKLEVVSNLLDDGEQEALRGLLDTAARLVDNAISGETILESDVKGIGEVRKALRDYREQREQGREIVWTLTTTVTLAASHRWITCS